MLLITGAPASGKSRLVEALGELHDCVYLSKDHFKEILFEQLGMSDAAWSRRLSDASFALMFALAARLLQPGRLLLLEGNFRAGEHEAPLRELLQAQRARGAQVLCLATAATRSARLAQRSHDPGRHPGHRDAHIQADSNASFLDLAGEQWCFDSDADWAEELSRLRHRLTLWRAAD